ncbi:MAG TPA: hypothetical protein VH476_04595 [Solirubrobacterales bacterium]
MPLLAALASVLLCTCAVAGGGPVELLGVLPPILLVVALACDRYPGEHLILRFADRRTKQRRRPARVPAARRLAESPARRRLAFLAGCRPLRGPPAALAL